VSLTAIPSDTRKSPSYFKPHGDTFDIEDVATTTTIISAAVFSQAYDIEVTNDGFERSKCVSDQVTQHIRGAGRDSTWINPTSRCTSLSLSSLSVTPFHELPPE
jgi:hypothetical protein